MSNFINPTTTNFNTAAAAPIGAAPIGSAPLGAAAPLGASPLGAAPLGGTTAATTMLPATGTGLMGHSNKHLSKQERKALKHQNKALKHDHHHGHHHGHGHGLTGTGLPLAGGATRGTGLGTTGLMHGATNVVEHQPIVEREVIVERPIEVKREHHIQPVIHERQHQIQPVIRTEITTERRDVVTDRNVMMPAVVEQPRLASTGLTSADQRGIVPGTAAGMTGGAHHATIGQKIKGTVKEVQGSLTHNPMKKEEGRLLKQGIEPTMTGTGMMGTTPGMTGTTTPGMMGTTPGTLGTTTGTTTPGVMGNTTRI